MRQLAVLRDAIVSHNRAICAPEEDFAARQAERDELSSLRTKVHGQAAEIWELRQSNNRFMRELGEIREAMAGFARFQQELAELRLAIEAAKRDQDAELGRREEAQRGALVSEQKASLPKPLSATGGVYDPSEPFRGIIWSLKQQCGGNPCAKSLLAIAAAHTNRHEYGTSTNGGSPEVVIDFESGLGWYDVNQDPSCLGFDFKVKWVTVS
jgi:hypothetical protein